MTDGICEICYLQNWMLEENGDHFVDLSKERENSLPLDEKIPLTKESVKDMFENGVDYELEYVVKGLNQKVTRIYKVPGQKYILSWHRYCKMDMAI